MTTRLVHSAVIVAALLAHTALASAQVAVLRIDPAADPVCRDVEASLQGVGVVADPGYMREANQQGMDPTTDATLELITPLLSLRLAVVPLFVDDKKIEIEYRDGRSGARLGTADIPLERGKIGPRGREQLRRDVVTHLGETLGKSAPPPSAAPSQELDEAGEALPAEADDEPEGYRSIEAFIRAGIGIGTRDVEWTQDGETQRVEMGAFPAVDLGLSFAFRLSDTVALVPALAYQSSLAFHEVEEARMGAPSDKVGVRAHRFAGVLGLEIRFGSDPTDASITPAVGVGIRNLRPEVHHLSTPAYSLAGPLLQIGIHVPLSEAVAIRVVPEAQLLFVGEGLRERGVEDSGLELGAEAVLAVQVLDPIALELAFREAHALLSSVEGGDAGDVERFVTIRGVGKL